jgi:hypothetical protein
MKVKEFIEAVSNNLGYGPCLYFGGTGIDCGDLSAEDIPLSIVISPAGFLGSCRIVGNGTWNTLSDNIDRAISNKPMLLVKQTNPPPKDAKGWYIFCSENMDEQVIESKKWILQGVKDGK